MRTMLTIADIVLIVALCAATAGSFYVIGAFTTGGGIALVQVDGSTVYKANLHESSVIELRGVKGKLTVETKEGKVAITSADCPNHICVRTGWRSRAGEVIVCVPNKVVVRILAGQSGDVRAVTG